MRTHILSYNPLNFYTVDQVYVDELQAIEPKVPNVQYEKHNKFVCGILFRIHGFDYFAPVSSFTKQQKTNFIIKNSNGKPVGCVRFSFMFPIPADLRMVKNFSEEDDARRFLLLEELQYCNRKARQIVSKAQHVYDMATSGKDPHLAAVCCDFKRLEAHLRERQASRRITPPAPRLAPIPAIRPARAPAPRTLPPCPYPLGSSLFCVTKYWY